MFGVLQQYLIESRQLPLQEVGQLKIVRKPAAYDVANQQIAPPSYEIQLESGFEAGTLQTVWAYIANELTITEEKAQSLYRQFCSQIKQSLENNGEFIWQNLGRLVKAKNEKPIFEPLPVISSFVQPVAAIRVVKEGASHNMVVGEKETTTGEMKEYLEESSTFKDNWWIAAIILGSAGLLLVLLRKFGYL